MIDDVSRKVAEGRLGTTLRGKYRLDRVLGVGGMAAVYAATHRNKKRFAIKMLHPELSGRQDVRTRFLREGYVANSVGHTGAVAVLDDDVAEDGSAFLVMELLEGTPLDALADKHAGRKLPLPLALSIGDALLDVLAAAHAKGIVHRDIKPANLFLTDDGRLEVLDFGIARLHDAASEHATQTGAMLGTPAFMAPEQAKGESKEIDAQTDLWAVGATLFTLVSGALVHEASNAQMLMVRAATTKARALASVASEVPTAIAEVIDRALAFEKTERWPSATAMREALVKAAGTIAPLPKTDRALGLETNVAPNAVASGTAFDSTVQTDDAKPTTTTEHGEREAPRNDSKPRFRRAVAAVIALVGVAAVSAIALRKSYVDVAAPASVASPAAPSASAAPSVSAPRPGRPPATPEAHAAWEAALQAERDGNLGACARNLAAAVAGDPAFGAAHLRLAILLGGSSRLSPDERASRDAYRKAVELRAALGEIELALLDAWEPRFREPPDYPERARRIEALADAYPSEPYLQMLLAWALKGSATAPWINGIKRALAADPKYAASYVTWITHAEMQGDWGAVRNATAQCLDVAPASVDCLAEKSLLDNIDGRCDDLTADARRMLAKDAASRDGNWLLAMSAFRSGESAERVQQLLAHGRESTIDPAKRRLDEHLARAWLAVMQGDLTAASVARAEGSSNAESSFGAPYAVHELLVQAALALEMNDHATARSLVTRARALVRTATTSQLYTQTEGWLAQLSAQVGVLSRAELAIERNRQWDARAALWESLGEAKSPFLSWLTVYAWGLATDELQGRDAVGALAERGIDLPSTLEWGHAATVGAAYALAGRHAEARPFLERTSGKFCIASTRDPAESAVVQTQWLYLLGLSREKTGDLAGAKEAYDRVLARWGDAKPRSVTAEKARAGLARIAKAKASK